MKAHHGFKTLLASSKSRRNPASAEPASTQSDVIARSEELGTDNVVYLEPMQPRVE